MPKKTYNLKRIEWKSGEKVVYFFPLYRLEIKTLSEFKLNPKHNDFYGLWLDLDYINFVSKCHLSSCQTVHSTIQEVLARCCRLLCGISDTGSRDTASHESLQGHIGRTAQVGVSGDSPQFAYSPYDFIKAIPI